MNFKEYLKEASKKLTDKEIQVLTLLGKFIKKGDDGKGDAITFVDEIQDQIEGISKRQMSGHLGSLTKKGYIFTDRGGQDDSIRTGDKWKDKDWVSW